MAWELKVFKRLGKVISRPGYACPDVDRMLDLYQTLHSCWEVHVQHLEKDGNLDKG